MKTVQQPIVPSGLGSYQVVVEEGDSVDFLISNVTAMGIDLNVWALKLYARFNPDIMQNIQVGEYLLVPGQNTLELFHSLRGGQVQERLTFLEGWRREEFASYLIEKIGEEFAHDFYDLTDGLDGQLFPDTYFIDVRTSPEILVEKIEANYQAKTSLLRTTLEMTGGDFSWEEVLNFASIVQREVSDPTDQAIVAGILIKRFVNGWPLEADATVQYTVAEEQIQSRGNRWLAVVDPKFEWWPKQITFVELEIDSAYNTRKHQGLPPTPISNPGLSSIEAVINPVQTSYWYYITDQEGINRYAETLDEHNWNIQMFGLSQ